MLSVFTNWVRRLGTLVSKDAGVPAASTRFDVAEAVWQLFTAHGIAATLTDGVIRFSDFPHSLIAAVFEQSRPKEDCVVVQLDVTLLLSSGEHIVESCAGSGATVSDAARNAVESFALNSLHVILTAFFGIPADDQVNIEYWEIAGTRYEAVISPMGARGPYPLSGPQSVEWFGRIAEEVRQQTLPRSIHWIRFFYAQLNSEPLCVEVLLDNETWEPMERVLAAQDWPAISPYYSVRVFLVLTPRNLT